jgi:adenylate cyclase
VPDTGVKTYQAGDLLRTELTPERSQAVMQVSDWVLTGARALDSNPNAILAALCERLVAAGINIHRAASIVELRNAEAFAVSRTWEAGKDVQVHMFRGGGDPTENYDDSPFAIAHRERVWVLTDMDSGRFSTLDAQREAGYVRHLVVPVMLANGMNNAFTFVTKDRDALTEAHLAMIRRIMPALGALQEILAIHRVLHEVMRMYVGDEPHRRILAGDARRGDTTEARAAILFADMREFTALTSAMTPAETTALLNRYYDCVVPPVEDADGEILKLIADGVLAIFAISDDESDEAACIRALKAARTALMAVSKSDDDESGPAFEAGIALHLGTVAYGNVGSGQRLDYTVIGRDVNIGARIASLCGPIGVPLLVSSDFADGLGGAGSDLVSAGSHDLKGVPEKQKLFSAKVEQ